MSIKNTQVEEVVIKFAGDSGDGMQLTGSQFSDNTALFGNDLSTFPDFPAEIRAPQGTIAGVSGFQIHFSDHKIYTPGDACDVLVAMNAAALKSNLSILKKGGILILNTAGFDSKNLRLTGIPEDQNPLNTGELDGFECFRIDISKNTKDALTAYELGTKDILRAKNMYVLGLIYWLFNRDLSTTTKFLEEKFSKNDLVLKSNLASLHAGYNFGETSELFNARYEVRKAKLDSGTYRSITGNHATALGIIAASELTGLKVFLGTYPITPASDILHELSKHKNFNVVTFQAEDEIAGITSAIGASFGGNLGFTTTSGPGMALKTEGIGLATMLETPLVIINVQRGGPSTGLPTKTEQSDLLQAFYGRNGEAPMPIIAAQSPSDCFQTVLDATNIAIKFMTPIIVLTDGYIANGAEPWKFPQVDDLSPIEVKFLTQKEGKVLAYDRDENLKRPWIKPGTPGMEHRVGGLEKENITGNVSYSPSNHELMTKIRAQKIKNIQSIIPELKFSEGHENDDILVLGWGGTYGVIKSVTRELRLENQKIAHLQLRHINPFPKELGQILSKYKLIIIPEINNGQLSKIITHTFNIKVESINKIQGLPFFKNELKEKITNLLETKL